MPDADKSVKPPTPVKVGEEKVVPPPPSSNPILDNLIKDASRKNAELSDSKDSPSHPDMKPDDSIKETLQNALASITMSERLNDKKVEIVSIFKNHGMDTMSQIKAWDELMSVLTLEE